MKKAINRAHLVQKYIVNKRNRHQKVWVRPEQAETKPIPQTKPLAGEHQDLMALVGTVREAYIQDTEGQDLSVEEQAEALAWAVDQHTYNANEIGEIVHAFERDSGISQEALKIIKPHLLNPYGLPTGMKSLVSKKVLSNIIDLTVKRGNKQSTTPVVVSYNADTLLISVTQGRKQIAKFRMKKPLNDQNMRDIVGSLEYAFKEVRADIMLPPTDRSLYEGWDWEAEHEEKIEAKLKRSEPIGKEGKRMQHYILKADRSHLVRQATVDRRGRTVTVWVNPNKAITAEHAKKKKQDQAHPRRQGAKAADVDWRVAKDKLLARTAFARMPERKKPLLLGISRTITTQQLRVNLMKA
jgi:hypothetical protein